MKLRDYGYKVAVLEKVYKSQKALAKSLGINPRSLRRYKEGIRYPRKDIRRKIDKRFSYYNKRYSMHYTLKIGAYDDEGNLVAKWFENTEQTELREGKREYYERKETVERETKIDGKKVTIKIDKAEIKVRVDKS